MSAVRAVGLAAYRSIVGDRLCHRGDVGHGIDYRSAGDFRPATDAPSVSGPTSPTSPPCVAAVRSSPAPGLPSHRANKRPPSAPLSPSSSFLFSSPTSTLFTTPRTHTSHRWIPQRYRIALEIAAHDQLGTGSTSGQPVAETRPPPPKPRIRTRVSVSGWRRLRLKRLLIRSGFGTVAPSANSFTAKPQGGTDRYHHYTDSLSLAAQYCLPGHLQHAPGAPVGRSWPAARPCGGACGGAQCSLSAGTPTAGENEWRNSVDFR